MLKKYFNLTLLLMMKYFNHLANCGAKYRGVGLCKMLITKVVYIPSENICRRVHITGCSADGTFFKSIKACEAKCIR